jgi:hypothetical protein
LGMVIEVTLVNLSHKYAGIRFTFEPNVNCVIVEWLFLNGP